MKVLAKIFLWIFAISAAIGLLFGGIIAAFAIARVFAPYVVIGGLMLYAVFKAAKSAEDEENQSIAMAKVNLKAQEAKKNQDGPIIP